MDALSRFDMERVGAARIMVVGCGALGNEVLKNLALSGVRHLTIVDFDRVEPDNLSRSVLFSRQDAQQGRYKVDAAANRLIQMNPDIEVQPVCGDIAYDVGLGLIRSMDVLIGCVDNRWARYCINRLCMRAGIPWVDGGINGLEGTVRVFKPGENCYACNLGTEGLKDMAKRMPCAGIIRRNVEAGKAPTTAIVASVIGAVQVQEALKLLHPKELQQGEMASLCGRMFYYEGLHLTTRTVEFKAYDDDCAVHDQWTVENLKSSVGRKMTLGEVLGILEKEFATEEVSLRLTDDCFVDYVVRRDNDCRKEVMRPGRAVAAFVEQDKELAGLPFSGLYEHEWSLIDKSFPYQHLTLADLGIPEQAVLKVRAGKNEHYIEIGR